MVLKNISPDCGVRASLMLFFPYVIQEVFVIWCAFLPEEIKEHNTLTLKHGISIKIIENISLYSGTYILGPAVKK